ncbi:MAG: thioredoxin family protein [Candidatus Babeliales bacterium]|jgi:thioredoxin-like negative regulator of GroEL
MVSGKKSIIFGLVCLIFITSNIYSYQNNNPKSLVEIVQATFKKEILDSPIPVILMITSKGNDTSRLLETLFLDVHKELQGRAKVVALNIDKSLSFAQELGVVTAPVLMIYNKGKKVGSLELSMSPAEIKHIVKYVRNLNIFTSLGYYRLLMKLLGKIT